MQQKMHDKQLAVTVTMVGNQLSCYKVVTLESGYQVHIHYLAHTTY